MRSSAAARPVKPKRSTKPAKPARAKLFQNGGSQAVRLPKDCRFSGVTEVLIRREGRRVILEAPDEWTEEFLACLGAWHEDIPRLEQGRLSDLRDPFD
jgi:antitoxin VapB